MQRNAQYWMQLNFTVCPPTKLFRAFLRKLHDFVAEVHLTFFSNHENVVRTIAEAALMMLPR